MEEKEEFDISEFFKDREDSLLRTIFLNLLIGFFMIMAYFMVSESFGSISTIYIENPEFFIQIGVTLFIFTYLSVLAGPIHGGIAGFIGEYLYQLAFYDNIFLQWCVIIGVFGFSVGLYKYKPLKYHNGKNVYYTFIALILASFFTMFLITMVQITTDCCGIDVEAALLNYGFKFLVQALISIVFFVPIFLIIYDKAFASEEKRVYHEILTHHPLSQSDHSFYLKFGRTKIYFCTRCSGFILGALFSMFLFHLITLIFPLEISAEFAFLLCIILPIPGLIDWGTQRMMYRKSTTESRLLTGFIIGVALHAMTYTRHYYFQMFFLLILYFSIFFIMMFIGQKKAMRLWKAQIEQLANGEDSNFTIEVRKLPSKENSESESE